jgi:hypothetical protein
MQSSLYWFFSIHDRDKRNVELLEQLLRRSNDGTMNDSSPTHATMICVSPLMHCIRKVLETEDSTHVQLYLDCFRMMLTYAKDDGSGISLFIKHRFSEGSDVVVGTINSAFTTLTYMEYLVRYCRRYEQTHESMYKRAKMMADDLSVTLKRVEIYRNKLPSVLAEFIFVNDLVVLVTSYVLKSS